MPLHHVAYATKAKLPLDNVALKELHEAFQSDADDAGRAFVDNYESDKERRQLEEFYRREKADKVQKRNVLMRDFERSVEQLDMIYVPHKMVAIRWLPGWSQRMKMPDAQSLQY